MSEPTNREIDAAVALKVMQWKAVAHPRPDSNECVIYDNCEVYTARKMSVHQTELVLFHPTESDSDAMAVLCVLIQKHKKSICFHQCQEGFEMYFGGGDYSKSTIMAATLPLVICLFSIKNILRDTPTLIA